MKQLYILRTMVLCIGLSLCVTYVNAATITSTTTGGAWATGGTWVGGIAPAATDDVVIANGHTVTITAAAACKSLTINTGGVLESGAFTLSITGAWVNNGTFTPGSGTVNFSTINAQINAGSGTANFNIITLGVNGASATLTINTNVTCTELTYITGSLVHTFTLNITGSYSLTVTGAVTLTLPTEDTSKNILSVGSGSLTCASIALGGGETVIQKASELSIGTGTVTVSGNITSSGLGSIVKFTAAGTLNVGGNFMSGTAGTFTRSTGKVNFNGAGAQASGAYAFNNLTLSNSGVKTFASPTSVYGILSMEGTATIAAAPTYISTATLQYNTTTARTAGPEWITPFVASGGVVISNTGHITANAAKVFSSASLLTINSGAELDMSTYLLTLNCNLINNGGTTSGSGGVTVTGTSAQSIGSFTTTGPVSITKASGTATLYGNVNGAALTINGTAGILNLGTSLTHTFSGNITLTAGTLNGGSSTLNANSTSTTAWGGTGSKFVANTGTVNFGGGNQTLSATATIFNNLTFSGTGTKILSYATTIGGAFSIATNAIANLGTITSHTAGTLWLGGVGQLSGTWGGTSSSSTYHEDSYFLSTATGIVTVSSGSCSTGTWTGTTSTDWHTPGNWCGGILPTSSTNVVIPAVTNQPVIGSAAVCNDITINSGATLSFSGSYSLTVSGNWSRTGTFTAGSGTVIFNGSAQTLSGSATTFNNLTLSNSGVKTLTAVPTVNGILSMEGTATVSTAPSFGTNATLQYNTTAPRAVGSEWLSTFAATGGVIIAGSGVITMNEPKIFNASVPLTLNNGSALATANYQLTFGGNFVNNGGTLTAGSSQVVLNGIATQSIAGYTTTGLTTMSKTGGTATFTGNVNGVGLTLDGSGGTLDLGSGLTHTFSGVWTRTTGTLQGGSSTLRLGSTVTNTAGTFTRGTGTVEYYSTGAQTVAPLTYNNLTLSGSGSKTTTGVTVNAILSMEGTATASALPTYTSSSTLQYKGSAAQITGPEFPAEWTGTGGVKIENAYGVTLNATKTFTSTPLTIGNSVPNSLLNDGGYQITASGTGTFNLHSGTFKLGSATSATSFPSFETITNDAGSTVEYAAATGATTQTVKGGTTIIYSNLTISGAGNNSKIADGNITVNGTLNLNSSNYSDTQGCLDMNTTPFTINMGADATTAGTGDVTGIIKRTHTFADNTQYSFGNQYTTITFLGISGGTKPGWLSCKITLGAAPTWKTDAIKRVYTFAQDNSATDKVIVDLHYLTGELQSNTDHNLVLWDHHSTNETEEHGKTNNDLISYWVGLSGLSLTYIAPGSTLGDKEWSLANYNATKNTWLGAADTKWDEAVNWSAAHVPSQTEDVLIPAGKTYYPVLTLAVEVKTLEIESGASLTTGTYSVTINGYTGALVNNGTFTSAGSLVFSRGTIGDVVSISGSGTNTLKDLTVNSNTFLQPATGAWLKISGTVTQGSGSIIDLTATNNTVEYNGSGQSILNLQGPTPELGYSNLVISGTVTLPATLNVMRDFTLNGGTATATAAYTITILGNVVLNSGTLAPSTSTINVSGDWTNNGATFSPAAGTVKFNNATASQTIKGTAATQTFYNLSSDKSGQSLIVGGNTTSITVGTLEIIHGSLNAGTAAIFNVNNNWISNGVFIPNSGTVSFTGSAAQTIAGATTFNNLTINNTAGVSITSENIVVNGVLYLQSTNASATQGTLHTGVNTLSMGADATTTGTGDVSGIVGRSSFMVNTPYTFGNQFTTLTMAPGGTLPSSVSFNLVLSTYTWITTGLVKRYYDIKQTGGSSSTNVTLNLHYLDTELNEAEETNLHLFDHDVPEPPYTEDQGSSGYNATDNWVNLANLELTYVAPQATFGTKYWTIGTSTTGNNSTWTGSTSTVWTNSGNWIGGVPNETSEVIIPAHGTYSENDPVLPTTTIWTMTIQSGGILNGTTGTPVLTIAGNTGAWNNTGTFNAGASTVKFTGSNADIGGITHFYNVEISTGAKITNQVNSEMSIAGTVTKSGTWDASLNDNIVEYDGAAQTVLLPDGMPNYHNLILSGSGTKTMPGSALFMHGELIMSGTASATALADITVDGTHPSFALGSGNTFVAGSNTITIKGNLVNNGATFTTTGSTFIFSGIIAQTITSSSGIAFNNLSISNTTASVILGTSTNCAVGGTLNISSGSVFDLVSNTLTSVGGTLTNSGTIRTQSASATPVPASKTWGGTFEYYGTGAQTIVAGTFNNLTISGAGGATSVSAVTVNGILNLSYGNPSSIKGSIDMASSSILTMGELSSTTGVGDVTGIVRRAHTFSAGVPYTFGNQFTFITFTTLGTPPTVLQAKTTIGTAPAWKGTAIKRVNDWIRSDDGTESVFTISAHYLDAELNGNTEENLVRWKLTPPSAVAEVGRTAINTTDNWVTNGSIGITLLTTVFGWERTYANSELGTLTWNGSVNSVWTTQENWTPRSSPSNLSNIVIPDVTNHPILPNGGCTVKSMTIQSGGILNSGDQPLTISGTTGAWVNNGTFNAGSGTVTFTGSDAYISGTTSFNNVTINSGVVLSMASGTIMKIAGAFTRNGVWNADFNGTGTVEYNGTDQTIVIPNPATKLYDNLILSGSGVKTMPSSAIQVSHDFTMSGSASATPGYAITVSGTTTLSGTSNLILGAAGVLSDTGPVTLNGGNFKTGATTGYSEIVGTLLLTDNSTIALGSGGHTLAFAASNAISWTAGKMLTITGWTGSWNGSAGTAGKIFAGSSASGLTTGQLAQIRFFNSTNSVYYSATIRSDGEIVPLSGATTWTWTGALTADWSTAGNWNSVDNSYPGSGSDVLISAAGTPPQISSAVSCSNLTINSGVLSVLNGGSLSVSGSIMNNSGTSALVIKSGGQIYYNGSETNAYGKVELTLPGDHYHFVVPPVEQMTIGSDVATAKTNFENNYFKGDLLKYDESLSSAQTNKDLGWSYFDGYLSSGGVFQNSPFSELVSSRGYNIYIHDTNVNNEILMLKGILNSGEHTFTLSKQGLGWNIIGNPYPCNYDLAGVYKLNNADQGVENSIYVNKDGTYAVMNVITASTVNWPSWSGRIIPPMQGFFVHASTDATVLTFPVASKSVTSVLAIAKSSGRVEAGSIKRIKLALSNSTVTDETIIGLLDDATTGFDGAYDAYKLFGSSTTIPGIYTELNSVKYAIDYLPGPVSEPVKIPLALIVKTAGTYKIDVTQFENLDGLDVYLREGTRFTKLALNTSYSLTSPLAAGTYTDFEIIISNSSTGVEKPSSGTEKFTTWYSNNNLYIKCPSDISEGIGSLTIYDLQGKPVYQNIGLSVSPEQTIQIPLYLSKGVYISRVVVNSQPYVLKIVII